MSKQPPVPNRSRGYQVGEVVTDPTELEVVAAQHRAYRKTAMGKIGCHLVIDAPVDLLAQVVAEMPADDQQVFLKELFAHLPAAALPQVEEQLKGRQSAAATPAVE